MITGHILLADWLFLLGALCALIFTLAFFIRDAGDRLPEARLGFLMPLSIALIAAGLWVL